MIPAKSDPQGIVLVALATFWTTLFSIWVKYHLIFIDKALDGLELLRETLMKCQFPTASKKNPINIAKKKGDFGSKTENNGLSSQVQAKKRPEMHSEQPWC